VGAISAYHKSFSRALFNAVSQDVLVSLSIDVWLDACPPFLTPQTPVGEAAQVLMGQASRCALVSTLEGGIAIYSDQDVTAAVGDGVDLRTTPIGTAPLTPALTLPRSASLATALTLLARTSAPGLLVLDDQGQPCGFLSRARLAQAQVSLAAAVSGTMSPAPRQAGGASPSADEGLTMITHIHYQLLSLRHQNQLRVYQRCLKLMGLTSRASRAALFTLHHHEGSDTWASLRTAWEQPGLPALLGESRLQNIPPDTLQRWHGLLAKGSVIHGMWADFPPSEQAFLATLEAESALILPLRYRSRYFGFLCFTRCPQLGPWPTKTIKLLRTAAISMSLSFEQGYTRQRLKETETTFASLFHHIPDPIAITTFPEGRYLLVNRGYTQCLGWDEANLVGQSPRALGVIHNRRQFVQLRRQLLQTGWVSNAEIDTRTADGQIKTLLVSSELTEFQGQTCLLSIGKDITERQQNQAAINAAEARFRAIFEQVSVGICQADSDGLLVDVNPGMCKMLGYSRAELMQKTFQQITYPADLDLDLTQYQQLMAGQIPAMAIEKRYLHREGYPIWVTLTVCLVRDEQGVPLFSLGVSQNIEDRKAAELALRRSEERFALAIENSKVGVWDWHPETNELYVSPNLQSLLGCPAGNLTMDHWLSQVHLEDVAGLKDTLMQHQTQPHPFEQTYRMVNHGGGVRWILSRGQRIGEADHGPLRLAGTHTDITDLKQAEVDIQASHQHITDILESITDAFFALDRHCQFTYLNQRAEQLLQRPAADLLGQNAWYEFSELLGTEFSKQFLQAMAHRQSVAFEEYSVITQSWYDVHVYPTQEDGLAVYFQDITERRLAYQKIEHQIRREQALNRVIQAIRRSLDLETIFATAAREVARLLQVDYVNIQRYQDSSLVWQVVAEYRTQPNQVSLLNQVGTAGETPMTQRLRRAAVVTLSAAEPSPPLLQALPGAWLLVPLAVSEAQPWGCLGIHRPTQASATVWQTSEIELVSTVADQLAIAIQQAQTLEQARHDLEERQRAEARLKEAQRIAHTGNWELRLPSRTLLWSEEMFRIYGLAPHPHPLSLEDQLDALDEGDRYQWQYHLAMACLDGQTLNLEGTIRRPDGGRRVVQLLGRPQRNEAGDIVGLVGTLTDITERKQIEERLAYEALHDPLTGIPNRACFMEQLNAAVQQAKTGSDQAFAVLFIDLDRFKVINDSLGHLVGDQLLIECAHRLGTVVRGQDLVARLGGDEFAILINDITTLDEAVQVAERIHDVLRIPVLLEDREIFISASVGVSSNLTGSVEAVDFLRDADTAMYRAKHNGRGRSALFDPQMYEQVNTQLTLENDLQRALERGELRLAYQPIVNLQTSQVVGFEALLRWYHPQWGVISPSTFIPLAEETGLILSLGEWIQTTACQQLQQWRQHLPQATELMISVNLSVKQFANPNLIASIDAALTTAHLDPHYLRLEITESALIENPETAESLLSALRERGIQTCIDDFGTGYSSLSMVHRFPVQILKIDRSFTTRLEGDPRGVAMVQSILALAQSLGMNAIAEGVETVAQWQQLQQLGCPYAQGYYIAKPLLADEVESFLQRWPLALPAAPRPSIGVAPGE
jgi:diguanylate cyclase (GGDEF)-like protein/PAS domain S-box-containing protein